jgi:hypothetical protein
MNKEQIFENSYIISLNHRIDRRLKIEKEFAKHNLVCNFFDAVNGHELNYSGPLLKGEEGVRQSHIKLFENCIANKNNSLFIFEDDVELINDFNEQLNLAIESLPSDVDMLYLGASHHQKPILVKNNIYKVTHSYTAHALWISSKLFLELKNLIIHNSALPVDVIYAAIQPRINAYAVYPHLAWQYNSYSDIQNKIINYDFLKKEFVRFESLN